MATRISRHEPNRTCIWARLKLCLKRRKGEMMNIQQLEDAIVEEWTAISKDFIDDLITSMPRRVRALAAVRGGVTKYL